MNYSVASFPGFILEFRHSNQFNLVGYLVVEISVWFYARTTYHG